MINKTTNRLWAKKLTTKDQLIEHVRLFISNRSLDGVSLSWRNRHYPLICSTIFALSQNSLYESDHIAAGRRAIQILDSLDQFSKLPIKVGKSVAIINYQLQGEVLELWGFTSPKTIIDIKRDPTENSIVQFEFDDGSVWPRTENAEYQGHYMFNSAFFGDTKSAEQALTILALQVANTLKIQNHIESSLEESIEEHQTVELDDAELTRIINLAGKK